MQHYPDVSNCRWWHSHIPASLLSRLVRNSLNYFDKMQSMLITKSVQTKSNSNLCCSWLFGIKIFEILIADRNDSSIYRWKYFQKQRIISQANFNFRQNNSILEFNDHFILSIFRLAADYSLIIEDSNTIVLSSKHFNDLNKTRNNTQKPFKEYKISTDAGMRKESFKKTCNFFSCCWFRKKLGVEYFR